MTAVQEAPIDPQQNNEVHEHLSRLAVMHEIPPTRRYDGPYRYAQRDVSGNYLGSMNNQYYPESATAESVPDWIDQDSSEKSRVLHAVRDIVAAETKASEEASKVQWAAIATQLLQRAEDTPEGNERDDILLASVVSSQFGPDPLERVKYIKDVYDRGLQVDVGNACKESPLSLLLEETQESFSAGTGNSFTLVTRRQHALKEFAEVFEADPKQLDIYLENVTRLVEHQKKAEDLPSAKRLGRTIIERYDTKDAVSDHAIEDQVVTVSMAGEKVSGSILDIYKVERFALQ